uniref:Uncharacterized protein n=1 Tax=Rhizophora mucronata TaxID=61149 RepID=A0A2P2JML7_RHIMU
MFNITYQVKTMSLNQIDPRQTITIKVTCSKSYSS